MWKRSSILIALMMLMTAVVMTSSSCIFDPKETNGGDVINDDPWPSLKNKEGVLETLQRSYNERTISHYQDILDQGFTFFLSDGDVNAGLPVQWDRGVEVSATTNLFSKSKVGDLPLVKNIEMDVSFAGAVWVEVIPASAPSEIWYTTTAFYFFQITVDQEGTDEDLTYYPDTNSKAQFTVRNAGTEAAPRWQLVEWRDLGAGT